MDPITYTHLTINELIWIKLYHEKRTTPTEISRKSSSSRQTVYKVINWLKKGSGIQDCYKNYKKRCGAKAKVLRKGEKEYVLEKIAQGWTPDVIEGRREVELSMSSRTLYRRFRDDSTLNVKELPMK